MWYLALCGMFALWVLLDGITRKIGTSVVVWILGTLLLGPIVLPIYLAKRPLKKGEVREGGKAWNVLKNFAILWTVFMAMAGFGALVRIGLVTPSLDSDAARAGAGLGMLLGMGFLAIIWFLPTCGAAVLGFLLKKNSIIETGPTGPLAGQDSPPGLANGWAGISGSAIIAFFIFIALARTATKSESSAAALSAALSSQPTVAPAPSQPKWTLDEKVNEMDNTKAPLLSLRSQDELEGFIGSHAAYLVIKCEKGKAAAYVSTGGPVQHEYDSETYGVRLRFDEAAPISQRWNGSTDDTALFSPQPRKFVEQLEAAKVLLFEFTPFEKTATTVHFNVGGLSEKLTPISGECGLATAISGISPSRPMPSRNKLEGSVSATTDTEPDEGNAPLKRKMPPASWIPKNPVVVQAALPQAKSENTVPGWPRGLVVNEYVPPLRKPGLVLFIPKDIEAEMGLLGNVLRPNDGLFWGAVTMNDDPSAPYVLTSREPAT